LDHFQSLQFSLANNSKGMQLSAQCIEDHFNNEHNRRRTTHFCLGCPNIWSEPVHSIVKTIKNMFKIQWLRVSVSNQKFVNLKEIFQGDLSVKLTVGPNFQDFEHLPCNCRTGGNGASGHINMCRNSAAVSKVNHNNTGNVCVRKTQQKFKAGMQQHFNEVQKLVRLDEKLDSHAKHFATPFFDANPSPANQCKGMTCSTI